MKESVAPILQAIGGILQAIGAIGWACLPFTVLFVFKTEIIRAFSRLRKGEFLGLKFELDELEKSADATAMEVSTYVGPVPLEENRVARGEEKFDATIKSILQQATSAPKVALIVLRAELEREARQALAARGMLGGRLAVSVSQALSELHQYGFPPNLSGSLKLFNDVSNSIIHGKTDATDDDVLRALDSGISILRSLNALPNEVHVVYQPGVEIFSDAAGTQPILDAKGVILENTSPGGVTKTFQIFPTTRTHFQKGKKVAWEWNMQKNWPAAWYRDPDTGVIKVAWGSSAEFIGRHLDDI